MAFTEEDLRAVLVARSEPVPPMPGLVDTAARRGRSVRRRRRTLGVTGVTLGACVTVAIVVNVQAGPGRQVLTPSVPQPSAGAGLTNEQKAARQSVVKITGMAPQCDRRLYGTGFVFAPDRVITAARGVAGVRGSVSVIDLRGRVHPGEVVLFDPKRDVAVLRVPGLRTPKLGFHPETGATGDAIVIGFARNTLESSVRAARIQVAHRASGPDLYRTSQIEREIYTVEVQVRPGDAGSPLVAGDGTVYGLIFASGLDAVNTGYALTSRELAPVLQKGRTAVRPVSTQSCSA